MVVGWCPLLRTPADSATVNFPCMLPLCSAAFSGYQRGMLGIKFPCNRYGLGSCLTRLQRSLVIGTVDTLCTASSVIFKRICWYDSDL